MLFEGVLSFCLLMKREEKLSSRVPLNDPYSISGEAKLLDLQEA
jgi:hypothetical protein